jgi:putative ABC transport system permease protein
MFRNFFLTAHRNIVRNKVQSIIQVISLSIGIALAILIGLYAKNELSYDRFNEKFDRIYRLEYGDQVGMPTAPGHQIKQEIPEVENVVRLVNWRGKDDVTMWRYRLDGDTTGEMKTFRMEDYFYCDSTTFDIFTFHFIQGDPRTALRDPNSVVMTESAARSIFGEGDPVGRLFGNLNVTGIIEDVKNSHLEVNMLMSLTSHSELHGVHRGDAEYLNDYGPDNAFMTYVLLPESNDRKYVEARLNDYFREHVQNETFQVSEEKSFSLRPLKDIYFSSGLKGERNYFRHGNMGLLKVLICIAMSILGLGIINYINLTTARATLRAKEVGVRKAIGSSKSHLVVQFLMEAILVAIFSFFIALILVHLIIPEFNLLASTDLSLGIADHPEILIACILAAILLGIISGIYPAFYLTRFKPVESMSIDHETNAGTIVFRRILLTLQFVVSIGLIIGVFVIFRQLHYMKTADLGFNKELVVNNNYWRWGPDVQNRKLFKEKLLKNPNISGVAFSLGMMGGAENTFIQPIEMGGHKIQCAGLAIDPDFLDLMEIKLLDGRNLSWDMAGDYLPNLDRQPAKVLINETAMKVFGLDSPVGHFEQMGEDFSIEIIGVVKDFNFLSLHEKIEPAFFYWHDYLVNASIKISPTNIPLTMRFIKKEFQSIYDDEFNYTFLDETFDQQYKRDEQTARIISYLAIIAIVIACLGLFGLSTFMAARRTKEIGIRKVLGATVGSVFLLLSREFLKWVVLSIAIALPAAWFILNKWLQGFAYRTNIAFWIFLASILIAVIITFTTVTWQSLKTARTNPVDSLRYE